MRITKQAQGFTVLELMVAMAIAMVVLGIAVPSFLSWLPTLRLSSAARQVATDLQVARMKAISQNASYTIAFNTTTGVYTYGSDSRDIDQEYPGISIQSVSPSNPVFTPRGTASAAVTITLSNGSGQKLVCVKTVGRVNIADSSCA
ncbi:MAG: GspH/FimT family pseudopilin [Deltaproteobacteria bacterium]|nr:GspH/FimT family pseudopilin [Deltaproteobacteria bacterium]